MTSLHWTQLCGNSSPFWNQQLTWNTTNPELTQCFHKTVLVWLPCTILWLFLPLHLYYVRHSKARHIPWSLLNVTKLVITTLLVLLWTFKLSVIVSYFSRGEHFLFIDFLAAFMMTATFLLVWILIYFERKQGMQSSPLLFFFWFCLSVTGAFTFASFIKQTRWKMSREEEINYSLYMVHYPLVVSHFILSLFNDSEPLYRNSEFIEENACPKNTASFISRLLFLWFDRFLWHGYRKNLEAQDVWKASPEVNTKHSVPELLKFWKKHSTCHKPPSLQSIVWKSQWPMFLKIFIIRIFGDAFIYSNPLLLNQILNFVGSDEPFWHGYVYVALMFLGNFAESVICWHASFYSMTSSLTIKSSFTSMVYRKTLTLCSGARHSATSGEVMNHMAIDIDHITDFILDAAFSASFPLQIAIGITMLYNLLGVAAFAGLGTMVLLKFVSGFVAHQIEKIETKQLKLKDQRIKQISEAILGVRVLKLFAWEKPFMQRISDIRLSETQALRHKLIYEGAVTLLWTVSSTIVSLVTFTTYLMIDTTNTFDASKAFVTITLVDILSIPMMRIPMVLAEFIQAYVSMGRLNKFMAKRDLDPTSVTHDDSNDCAISIQNATFLWSSGEEPILKNVDLEILKGSLVAIVGTVGCGKSSVISAILGEMEKVSGTVHTEGRIAYVAQQAWIQNATLKNNVLFGKLFQEEFYGEVIKACALESDLAILPGGSETEIGEKGVNLSGGQKQRVSLARAVYNNADVYLLDDPLSAVDAHVGKHIFDHIIGPNGLLKNKTRVLVTHSITYLPFVDQIIVLSRGSISESGTFNELLQRNGDFAEFLATYGQTSNSHATNFMRSDSIQSRTTNNDDEEAYQEGAILTTAENVEYGEVNKSVYGLYIKYVGIAASCGILLLIAIAEGWSAAAHVWLSMWSSDPESENTEFKYMRLGVYAALGISYGLFLFLGIFTMVFAAMKASIGLHSRLLYSILRCPVSFFDTTPSGRIVNRFSKDIDTVDSVLPNSFLDVMVCTLEIIVALVIICINMPYLALAFIPISVIYFFIQKFFVRTADQLRRLESTSRSPIFSRFSETLVGCSTVRAYQRQNEFVREFDELVDTYLKNVYYLKVLFRWIGLRLDLLGNILIFATAMFSIHQRDSMSASTIALIITYASSINFTFCWLVHNVGMLESNIVSVERLHEYICLKSEASWEDPNKPPASWPTKGHLEFRNFSTKYREELAPVLHGLTCEIKDGEKVGIVGRTGAGKSSITLSLFRIIEGIEGAILIDGIDISTIGLHYLRTCLTIIPQDPILFSGTLRDNLDPFSHHNDSELWRALELSHLKEHVTSLSAGLLHEVAEGGANLSVGQRQLLCLARALLRKSKILILDEATAAVDLETDDLIQDTIRREFADCTVLTIAHRINTIMDSTRVMVMDSGTIKEFDNPSVLLTNKKSLFYSIAKSAGTLH